MRGTGIINNELYAGVLVWNRQRFIKDPSTGKRVSRPNPQDKWIRSEVPHLRIVDDESWNAVRARQKDIAVRFEATAEGVRKAKARKLHEKKRPVSLLSGLLTCGSAGFRWIGRCRTIRRSGVSASIWRRRMATGSVSASVCWGRSTRSWMRAD